ncbi:hypothetical protein [Nocardia asteroides]|uniref:hypothetical protein n=1 Tax=Nocardia asteroides TaxID=1824 RepID=UPI001E3890CF|nr:hypothetical protein [Nocardia asteroides]UGT53340.1 hypothetical protein LTT85_21970 [Nocardia asteroides]
MAIALVLTYAVVRTGLLNRTDDPYDVAPDHLFAASLSELGHPDGITLSNEAPSASFVVALPVDSTRPHTRLRLSGTTQVAEDSTVFLIVSMDGQQVYQQELSRGRNDLSDTVTVPDKAASDGKVRVTVRTRGNLAHEPCTTDRSAGQVITLAPETALEAVLDEPVHTLRDAISGWSRTLTLVLTDTSDPWRSTAASTGVALHRAGYVVRFATAIPADGPGNIVLFGSSSQLTAATGWSASTTTAGDDLALGRLGDTAVVGVIEPDPVVVARTLTTQLATVADAASTDPRTTRVVPAEGDAVALSVLGADSAPVDIIDSHRWRAHYRLADLPGGRLPKSLRVAFQLPASPADLAWLLTTEVNGQILDSRRLEPTRDPVVIGVPPEIQLLDNTVTLTVQRDRDLGGCEVRQSAYPIQLLDASAVELGDDPGAGFTALARELAVGATVYFPGADPASTANLLTAAVPLVAEFLPAHSEPELRWNAQPAPGRPFLVVSADEIGAETLVRVHNGRLVAGRDPVSLDISAFTTGLVVQCAGVGLDARGVAVQYGGDTADVTLPAFGRECVQVITPGASFTLDPSGALPAQAPR